MKERDNKYSNALDDITLFCEERDWAQFHNPKDIAVALSIESIELLELFRWKSTRESEDLLVDDSKRTDIEHEVADNAFFLLLFCKNNNIDLWDVLDKKMKLNKSKYPIERVKGRSKKYNEYEEYSNSDSLSGDKS